MPGAPPYRLIAERHVTDRLLHANAVWPGSGQPLELTRGSQRRALARLIAAGVVREEGDHRYYLYAPAFVTRVDNRRRRLLIAMICVIVAMFAALALVNL
jgi:hypothetical protein